MGPPGVEGAGERVPESKAQRPTGPDGECHGQVGLQKGGGGGTVGIHRTRWGVPWTSGPAERWRRGDGGHGAPQAQSHPLGLVTSEGPERDPANHRCDTGRTDFFLPSFNETFNF